MCGIVGLIDTVEGRVSPGLLAALRDAMVLRGPDGEGQYLEGPVGMAMRRLSIIDLESGWQPFFSREGEVVAFQNGEIYNYRELRRQLEQRACTFTSRSDTEVLAHGYGEWGIEGLLERLDGMHAIAILDRASRELHLARDRFGEKPLFYTHSKGRFAYSSSLLALAALPWVSDELDPQAMDRYLALHYTPGSDTLFKSIKRVLPGERLQVAVDDPLPRRHRYYEARLGKERKITDDLLAETVEQAVESRLVADVPVGVFLSGGLDSSIVAAIAASKQPRISTFSMGFSSASHDESRYAQAVAESVGSDHHHFMFDEESFRSLLPRVAAALDEPVGDQAQLPLHWLCQEARRHVKVALAGEGADEIFAGYGYYQSHVKETGWREKLKTRLGRGDGDSALETLIGNADPVTPSGFPLLTDVAGRRRLTGTSNMAMSQWEAGLFDWLNRSGDGLQRAAATDIATWLPDDLLVKFDRMSMAHSLEGRAPYLAPRVVEAGLALPQSQKINGSITKVALRRIASRWLPREIIERPKQGFVLPMARWLAQWFGAQPSARDYYLERAMPGLDMKEVARLTEQDLSEGVRRERLLFALVLLIEWYQSFKGRRYELARKCREAIVSEGRLGSKKDETVDSRVLECQN
ncbi:MAG TPA: asparagine synthase (glutamine-hydrolyzing) [Blastocatellia bacterium]|nr:asparagine synthase (glutamine-hydrolyzing) [Blastocatellia bacterium]